MSLHSSLQSPAPEPGDARAAMPAAVLEPTLRIPVIVELRAASGEDADASAPTLEAPRGGDTPPSPAPGPDLRGRAAGRYVIRDVLGRGGMGLVYRAFDRDLRREVAMKVMLGQLDGDADLVARFVEEAQATAQLQHPGIVPVYEIGLDDQARLYFTMKLVRGRTLSQVVEAVRAGEPEAVAEFTRFRLLQALVEVARTVAYAHARDVVHRDLKPQNVMIGAYGEVQVLDWGLAKIVRELAEERAAETGASEHPERVHTTAARDETQAERVIGTPAYMAPEQAVNPGRVGPAADIYALGAILYHVLIGRAPFAGSGSEEILAKVLEEEPTAPRALDPSIPRELAAICLKALAKRCEDRYHTARALADDLQAFLEERPVVAHPEGFFGRAAKWAKRHRGITRTVAAATVLGLIGTSAALFALDAKRREAESARAIAQGQSEEAERQRRLAEHSEAQVATQLEEIRRLADVKRLQDLEAEAEELWPADSARVVGLEAWLERARPLAARLPLHRERLEHVRSLALPQHGDPEAERTWTFPSDATAWEHRVLEGLVEGLARFSDPDAHTGAVASVEARLDVARALRQRSLVDHEDTWREAVASIADREACLAYDGLHLVPQEGLVPIGRDPDSGLWEFCHVCTGERPVRDADGRVTPNEAMGVILVLIPGGTFRMGAVRPAASLPLGSPHVDPYADDDEWDSTGRPVSVTLAPFFLSKYELTQAQWLRATGEVPSGFPPGSSIGDRVVTSLNPVEQVSWDDCRKVLPRLGLALPTEAQWEFAARAGTTSVWWTGDEAASLADAGNLGDASLRSHADSPERSYEAWDDGHAVHAPVGTYRANPFGLHDVAGNVAEWCADGYGSYDVAARPRDGLREPSDFRSRVQRGGDWRLGASPARSACRDVGMAPDRYRAVGVRPARAITE